MAEGKSLKFQFVLDEQSFARVKRALGELTTEAQKFAKAMQGSGGGAGLFGGANVGRPPSAIRTQGKTQQKTGVGAAILGDIEAFQKLAKSGKDGMNAMTDAVRKGIREQMQEIEKLDRKMATLQSRFNKDPRAAYEGAFRENLQRQMLSRQGQLSTAQENLASLKSAQAGLAGMGGGAGGSSVGPMASAATVASVAKIAGVAAGVAIAGLNESMGGTRTYTTQEATRSQLMNSEIRRLRTGDVTGMMALRTMLKDPARASDLRDQSGLGARFEAAIGGVGSAVKGTANMLTGGLFGGGGSQQGALTGLSDASRNTEMMQNTLQQVRNYEQSTDFSARKVALERFYGNFESRKSAGRILGVGLSKVRNPQTGAIEVKDSFGALEASLTGSGYDVGSYASSYASARNAAGAKFARKNAFGIMAAQAAGYNGYGEMMSAAERSGRSNAGLMALGGGIGPAAGILLGQGVLGSGFDVRGTTGGMGVLSAAQGPGFNFNGGSGDFNQVQQVLAGLQLGSSIGGGGLDQYQAGRNIINAIGINPSGSTYAQDYLGTGMSMKQMMDAAGGDVTKTAKALGITSDMARQQLSGSMSSVMDRFVDQGANDPMSQAIRGYRKSGQSVDKYLNSLYKSGNRDQADAIGAYFGMISGEGEEAGIGLAGLLGGIGTGGKLGKGPAGGRGQMEKLVDEQRAAAIKDDVIQMETMFDDMAASLKLAPAAIAAFTAAGTDLSKEAAAFVKTLENLAAATDAAAYRISQGKLGTPLPAPPKGEAPNPWKGWVGGQKY